MSIFQAVADTSVLMGLGVINSVGLLCRAFCAVALPGAVAEEAERCRLPGAQDGLLLECWKETCFRRVDLDEHALRCAAKYRQRGLRIDPGEAEVLGFAKGNDLIALTDDLHARRLAKSEGIAHVGSLGILSLAKREGWISACRPLVEKMVLCNRHLAPSLVEEFLRKEGEV